MKRLALLATVAATGTFAAHAGPDPTFEAMDTNGDGYVIESEFLAYHMAAGKLSEGDALVKFIMLDADGSGGISPDELKADKDTPDTPADDTSRMPGDS